jgi:lipopolysaccharide/colanic/teichoic acid biosynthesis glycosyltransferase
MAKRLFDIASSAMGLLFTGLPMVLITIAIKLLDPGPVLYRQRRIGRGGQPFWLYKFRTMKVCESGPVVTIEGDPRVTPIGRFLRRWKLDELPQLWNVLRGEMSVVGPRPEVQRFVDLYTPAQRRLLQQNPGLASLSQLVYPHEADLLRQNPNAEEIYIQQLMPRKIALDIQYGENRTFWSDLRLIAEVILLIAGASLRRDRDFRIDSPEKTT